jgi:hypothetical protein
VKKFGVIHHSENWVAGTSIEKFDTKREADAYVKQFRGNKYHARDVVEVIEVHSKHEADVIDQTDTNTIHGFKEVKEET